MKYQPKCIFCFILHTRIYSTVSSLRYFYNLNLSALSFDFMLTISFLTVYAQKNFSLFCYLTWRHRRGLNLTYFGRLASHEYFPSRGFIYVICNCIGKGQVSKWWWWFVIVMFSKSCNLYKMHVAVCKELIKMLYRKVSQFPHLTFPIGVSV